MSKWKEFYDSAYSPVEVGTPHGLGDATMCQDWSRRARNSNFFINNEPLSIHANNFNNFENDADVEKFIEEVLLLNINSNTNKLELYDFLIKNLHQGSLLCPLSGPLSTTIKDPSNHELAATLHKPQINTYITTSETGIKIQEFVQVNSLKTNPQSLEFLTNNGINASDEYDILPEKKPYVLKGQATIAINFPRNAQEPIITIESNTISYGHSGIKKIMDNRSLFQRIIDYFKSRLNPIKCICTEDPVKKDLEHRGLCYFT